MPPKSRPAVPKAGDTPDTILKLAEKRTKAYLDELRTRYPSAFTDLNRMAATRGRENSWPDWCWLPMGASATVVSSGSNRLLPTDARTADLPRMAALSTWRLTKGIYWLDNETLPSHVEQLWKDRANLVPANPRLDPAHFQQHLPQHGVYVVLPPIEHPVEADLAQAMPLGLFIHLEHDLNNGRPELRIVADTDGTWEGLMAMPVLLDRLTLLASTRELGSGPLGALLGDQGDEDTGEALTKLANSAIFGVWPIVTALTDPDYSIGRWDLPGQGPEPARPVLQDGREIWPVAEKPTRWRVSAAARRPTLA